MVGGEEIRLQFNVQICVSTGILWGWGGGAGVGSGDLSVAGLDKTLH